MLRLDAASELTIVTGSLTAPDTNSRAAHTAAAISANIIMSSSRGIQSIRPVSRTFNALPAAYAGAQVASRRQAGTIANFKIPTINNEPNVSSKLGAVSLSNGD